MKLFHKNCVRIPIYLLIHRPTVREQKWYLCVRSKYLHIKFCEIRLSGSFEMQCRCGEFLSITQLENNSTLLAGYLFELKGVCPILMQMKM